MDKEDEVAILARLKGKKRGGKLDFFTIRAFNSSQGDYEIAYGYIYGDDRFTDGEMIRTSIVTAVHEDMKIIETRNTYYDYDREATPQHEKDLFSQFYF